MDSLARHISLLNKARYPSLVGVDVRLHKEKWIVFLKEFFLIGLFLLALTGCAVTLEKVVVNHECSLNVTRSDNNVVYSINKDCEVQFDVHDSSGTAKVSG